MIFWPGPTCCWPTREGTDMRAFAPSRFLAAAALCLALGGLCLPARADDAVSLTVKPGDINISATYTGTVLHVAGRAPAGSAIVARFTGDSGNLALRQKGKVFGLLWMNLGTVHLDNVPSVCLVAASGQLADIGGLPLGIDAVRGGIQAREGTTSGIDLPAELIKLKEHDGLYREEVKGVSVKPNGDFAVDMPIPSRMSPGAYSLDVFALRNGVVEGRVSSPVTVKLVGMPAWIDHMATKQSLLYGILSTLVAIFGGLLIGLVCQRRGAH